MLIGTHHGTVLAMGEQHSLIHAPINDVTIKPLRLGGAEELATTIRSHWKDADCLIEGDRFTVKQYNLFLRADPSGKLAVNSGIAGEWETFHLLPENMLAEPPGLNATDMAEFARFQRKVDDLNSKGESVKVQFAAAWKAIPGFLNIDRGPYHPNFIAERPDEYFVFPTVGVSLPIESECIDYIFHEDFIEHIDQLSQIQFLAETLRLLKPGGVHRVNTPSLLWIMKLLSRFDEGATGVYTGEQRWGHVSLFSKQSLCEVAQLVGYREVIFNGKGYGVSPYAALETRPDYDRDPIDGNIFADLIK